jgi:hypothetical protein
MAIAAVFATALKIALRDDVRVGTNERANAQPHVRIR